MGEAGKTLTNADLDECHGHTHAVMWDGTMQTIYHYHFTAEFPYTVSCYKGSPVRVDNDGSATATATALTGAIPKAPASDP